MKYIFLTLLCGVLSGQAFAFSWDTANADDYSLGENLAFYQANDDGADFPHLAVSESDSFLVLLDHKNSRSAVFPYDQYHWLRGGFEKVYCNGKSCIEMSWKDKKARVNQSLYVKVTGDTVKLERVKEAFLNDVLKTSIKRLASPDLSDFADFKNYLEALAVMYQYVDSDPEDIAQSKLGWSKFPFPTPDRDLLIGLKLGFKQKVQTDDAKPIESDKKALKEIESKIRATVDGDGDFEDFPKFYSVSTSPQASSGVDKALRLAAKDHIAREILVRKGWVCENMEYNYVERVIWELNDGSIFQCDQELECD